MARHHVGKYSTGLMIVWIPVQFSILLKSFLSKIFLHSIFYTSNLQSFMFII